MHGPRRVAARGGGVEHVEAADSDGPWRRPAFARSEGGSVCGPATLRHLRHDDH